MAGGRQQRTSRVRYAPKRSVPPIVPAMQWRVDAFLPGQVVIVVDNNPVGMSLVGLPKFRIRRTGEFCTSCVLGAPTIIASFSDELGGNDVIELGYNDPAIRSAEGAFLVQQAVTLAPLPPELEFTLQYGASNEFTINTAVPLNEVLIGSYEGWESLPTGYVANYWENNGTTWKLSFPADVSGETGVRHNAGWNQHITLAGQRIAYGDYFI